MSDELKKSYKGRLVSCRILSFKFLPIKTIRNPYNTIAASLYILYGFSINKMNNISMIK